ncbi:MAG: mechanosensitive ion channel [Sediminibacterium sp.]|jgi:MscS family membrane protein|nr:mechanosensitive ion channel [Sediminibacterium sp.]MBP7939596.1 mechanosensitive ion channel [Sediminibacterium sp.]
MNLEQQILSNSLRSYLFILGVLLVTLLIKRLISRFFASLIYTWVDKKNHSDLRKSHVHRLLVPIEQFLLFLVAIIALYELKFPEAWDLKLFKLSLQLFIEAGIKFIFIILLIRVSLRTLEFISIILENKARLTKDLSDDQLVLFFRDFFKVIIYIIGILMVLRYVFNESIGNLVTSLSIVGAAVALSTRESLENIIASFIIFFDKPFTIGDLVKVNGFTGTIEKIGLRSTRIRTQEKTYISVPNKQMVDSIVDNISLRSERKIEMDLQLSVQTTAAALALFANHMRAVLQSEKGVNSFNVFVAESGKQFHSLHIECLVTIQIEVSEFQMIRERLNLAAIEYANEHQIQFSEKG